MPSVKPTNTARPQVKLLTAAEMSARREKGLCFNCDEKFSPGHKCKQRAFMIMTESEELCFVQTVSEESEMENAKEHMDGEQVSFNAIQGNDGISTMRFISHYGEQQLQILIDTGSTLSFIKKTTTMRLDCSVEVVSPLLSDRS